MGELIGELFAEIAHEITVDPGKFGIELVQFALLVAIVWAVAVGFGKRKGIVVNMLAKRQDRVGVGIARMKSADGVLEDARVRAAEIKQAGRDEAARIVSEARATARQERAQSKSASDAEAAQIRSRAKEVLDAELAEMHVEVRDRLVDVVAHATRSILNEGLTMAEQRDLIQNTVTGGIDRMELSLAEHAPDGPAQDRGPQ